ncbi:MAG TPA: hypothetical protein VF278_22400 [Pirellulales bacterium]
MTTAELKVMEIFRFYSVAPYQMLCLDSKVQHELRAPLDQLVQRGLIVREDRHNAYHLTMSGYDAVKSLLQSG